MADVASRTTAPGAVVGDGRPRWRALAVGLAWAAWAGCGGARQVDVRVPEVPVAAPEVPGPRTPEECEAEAVAAGLTPGCRWEVVERAYCGGPPPPHPDYGRHRACVCHACDVDADCGGERRCVAVPGSVCAPGPRRLCVAPGAPCYPGTTCPEGTTCMDWGEPVCGELLPPPP